MKVILLMFCSIFFAGNVLFAQAKFDTSAAPTEVTYFDGAPNTVFSPGYLLKTRSKNFYEITGKKKYVNKVPSPQVKVYQAKKRKYELLIQGIEEPISAVKVSDVIESNIDGDFSGWDGTTSFKLLNGDVWVQDEIKTLFSKSIFRPVVYIYPSSDGTYKMKIAGIDETLQVKKK